MKNSTYAEIQSVPSADYRDLDFLNDLKKSKKPQRWITCVLCGKTITKLRMVKHQVSCHKMSTISKP